MTMLLLGLMLLSVPVQNDTADVTVRAKRTREALDACIASHCPTPDDVRISMAHAEAQFAGGRYHDARRTLNAALSRQKRNAAQFPRMVSALYEANATINLHMGDMKLYRTMMIGQNQTLKANLPADDPQVLTNAILLGDFWVRMNQPFNARAQFVAASEGYARRGEHRLAALTQLRAASIDIQFNNLRSARDRLDTARVNPAASDVSVRQLAAVVAARLARARGDEGAVETLLAELRTDPAKPPMLVRDVPVVGADPIGTANAVRARMGDVQLPTWTYSSPQILWADIGFLVAPDGHVSDVDILRGSRTKAWIEPFIEAIQNRQYARIDLPAGSPGLYRVERLTWRPERIVATGSLIKQPVGRMDVQILDITNDAPPPPSGDAQAIAPVVTASAEPVRDRVTPPEMNAAGSANSRPWREQFDARCAQCSHAEEGGSAPLPRTYTPLAASASTATTSIAPSRP